VCYVQELMLEALYLKWEVLHEKFSSSI